MNMRIHRLATHLRAEEAFALIELIDQLRDSLMQAYGDNIGVMLRQASVRQEPAVIVDEGEPF